MSNVCIVYAPKLLQLSTKRWETLRLSNVYQPTICLHISKLKLTSFFINIISILLMFGHHKNENFPICFFVCVIWILVRLPSFVKHIYTLNICLLSNKSYRSDSCDLVETYFVDNLFSHDTIFDTTYFINWKWAVETHSNIKLISSDLHLLINEWHVILQSDYDEFYTYINDYLI